MLAAQMIEAKMCLEQHLMLYSELRATSHLLAVSRACWPEHSALHRYSLGRNLTSLDSLIDMTLSLTENI